MSRGEARVWSIRKPPYSHSRLMQNSWQALPKKSGEEGDGRASVSHMSTFENQSSRSVRRYPRIEYSAFRRVGHQLKEN